LNLTVVSSWNPCVEWDDHWNGRIAAVIPISNDNATIRKYSAEIIELQGGF
jgi:hypothetical protein